jgi:hypothetical protein
MFTGKYMYEFVVKRWGPKGGECELVSLHPRPGHLAME